MNTLNMATSKGLYVLALVLKEQRSIRVGKLGVFTFPAGVYLYIGSAWGPGGLEARVGRHIALMGVENDKPHWHLDYLLPFVEIAAVLTFPERRGECSLADKLTDLADAERFPPGFGATDCGCGGHLLLVRQEEVPDFCRDFEEDATR